MIRTRGPTNPPGTNVPRGDSDLRRLRGLRATRVLSSSDFDRGIYAAASVRNRLWKLQHGKCCYCERRYERKHSDVEHFRPKTRVDSDGNGPPVEGYWWLAYDLDNLYFACANCNRRKGSRFPIRSGRRLTAEEHPRSVCEDPTLLEPRHDDVEAHLTFERLPNGKWQIAPRNGSLRGAETIRILCLDRDDLTDLRNKHWKEHLRHIANDYRAAAGASKRRQLVSRAQSAKSEKAEFALLARVSLANVM